MDLWADDKFRRSSLVLFTIYILLGTFGVLWISDEFDSIRMSFYRHIGFPLALGFYCMTLLSPHWLLEKRRIVFSLMAIVSFSFLWGNLLLIDYFNGSNPMDPLGKGVIAYKQGISGQLYQTRF